MQSKHFEALLQSRFELILNQELTFEDGAAVVFHRSQIKRWTKIGIKNDRTLNYFPFTIYFPLDAADNSSLACYDCSESFKHVWDPNTECQMFPTTAPLRTCLDTEHYCKVTTSIMRFKVSFVRVFETENILRKNVLHRWVFG